MTSRSRPWHRLELEEVLKPDELGQKFGGVEEDDESMEEAKELVVIDEQFDDADVGEDEE